MQTAFKDGSVMVCGTLPKDAVYKTVGQNSSSLTTFGVKVGEKPSPDVNRKADAVWCNCECWHSVARAAKGTPCCAWERSRWSSGTAKT